MKHPMSSGTITVILTLIAWSSVPLFLRHFAESIDAWTSNGWRYGFSAIFWAPVIFFAVMARRLPRDIWKRALVPAALNAVGQVTFCHAHYMIDPGLLTFGLRSQVIFATVGAYLMFPRERRVIRSPIYLAGMVALLGGTTAAVLLGREPIAGAAMQGIILSVVSGGLFAAYALAVRQTMADVNAVYAFAVISQYTAVVMILLMLALGERGGMAAATLPWDQLALLLLSGIIGIAMGHVLYYMSISRLGVAISSGVLQLHPFIVAIGSLLLFDEWLTREQWIGGGFALGGAASVLWLQSRLHRSSPVTPDTPLSVTDTVTTEARG